MKGNTVRELAAKGVDRLRRAGVESPRLDAGLLLAKVLDKDRHFLHVNPDYCPDVGVEAEYYALLNRRAAGEPLQYLTGIQEFMGLVFTVNPSVLIPRSDTETLVEEVLDRLKGYRGMGVSETPETPGSGMDGDRVLGLDLGTGSGAIAVSLACYFAGLYVKAVDISPEALRVAQKNAVRHGVADRIDFLRGDLFSPFEGTGQKFDLIVSNPPYISGKEMRELQREVLHEPQSALYGGSDGLCFYKKIVAGAPEFLKRGGLLAVEIGYDQAAAVIDLLNQTGVFKYTEVVKDLAGRCRVVLAAAHN